MGVSLVPYIYGRTQTKNVWEHGRAVWCSSCSQNKRVYLSPHAFLTTYYFWTAKALCGQRPSYNSLAPCLTVPHTNLPFHYTCSYLRKPPLVQRSEIMSRTSNSALRFGLHSLLYPAVARCLVCISVYFSLSFRRSRSNILFCVFNLLFVISSILIPIRRHLSELLQWLLASIFCWDSVSLTL